MIERVFRARRYWWNGDRVWFEECPIVHQTVQFVVARSLTFSTIQYPGGDFRLDKYNLVQSGRKYHSRHGEYFYLNKPHQGDLFPSKELLETPNFVEQEAAALGWDMSIPKPQWSEEDKACYLLALSTTKSLKEATTLLAKHGIKGVWEEITRVNLKQRERDMLLALAEE